MHSPLFKTMEVTYRSKIKIHFATPQPRLTSRYACFQPTNSGLYK